MPLVPTNVRSRTRRPVPRSRRLLCRPASQEFFERIHDDETIGIQPTKPFRGLVGDEPEPVDGGLVLFRVGDLPPTWAGCSFDCRTTP
jgi:hypothetical protein